MASNSSQKKLKSSIIDPLKSVTVKSLPKKKPAAKKPPQKKKEETYPLEDLYKFPSIGQLKKFSPFKKDHFSGEKESSNDDSKKKNEVLSDQKLSTKETKEVS